MTESVKQRCSSLSIHRDGFQIRRLFEAVLADLTLFKAGLAAGAVDLAAIRARNACAMLSPAGLVLGTSTGKMPKTTYPIMALANGVLVFKPAGTDMSVLPASTTLQDAFGLWAFYIDSAGTITTSDRCGNTSTAALAFAAMPAVPANKTQIGAIIVTDSNSSFVAGTDSLNASGVTCIYIDCVGPAGVPDALTITSAGSVTLVA